MSWLGQLTPADWALFVGLLANAAVMLFVSIKLVRKVDIVQKDVKVIAKNTNGIHETLVAAAFASGEVKGRADQKLDEAERQKNGKK